MGSEKKQAVISTTTTESQMMEGGSIINFSIARGWLTLYLLTTILSVIGGLVGSVAQYSNVFLFALLLAHLIEKYCKPWKGFLTGTLLVGGLSLLTGAWSSANGAEMLNKIFSIDPDLLPITLIIAKAVSFIFLIIWLSTAMVFVAMSLPSKNLVKYFLRNTGNMNSAMQKATLIIIALVSSSNSALCWDRLPQDLKQLALLTDFHQSHRCVAEELKNKPVVFLGDAQVLYPKNDQFVVAECKLQQGK